MKKTLIAVAVATFISTGAFAAQPAHNKKPAPKPAHVVEHTMPHHTQPHHAPKPAHVANNRHHHKQHHTETRVVHHYHNKHTDFGDVLIAFAILAAAL
ncbi:MAG: hypothetical protein IKP05_03565 [Alphaproteobacteria bacterium]|nr:hypothetical protein [Alphaproteobacteria bacterium]